MVKYSVVNANADSVNVKVCRNKNAVEFPYIPITLRFSFSTIKKASSPKWAGPAFRGWVRGTPLQAHNNRGLKGWRSPSSKLRPMYRSDCIALREIGSSLGPATFYRNAKICYNGVIGNYGDHTVSD